MGENIPTGAELVEKREHLIQKAGNGEKLSSEEKHFLDLIDVSLAKKRDEQAQKTALPFIEKLKKCNPFVKDVFRDTTYFELALWCIEVPEVSGVSKAEAREEPYGCWITTDNNMTYEEMCRLLENVKSDKDIQLLSTTPEPALAISAATPRWKAEVKQIREQLHES